MTEATVSIVNKAGTVYTASSLSEAIRYLAHKGAHDLPDEARADILRHLTAIHAGPFGSIATRIVVGDREAPEHVLEALAKGDTDLPAKAPERIPGTLKYGGKLCVVDEDKRVTADEIKRSYSEAERADFLRTFEAQIEEAITATDRAKDKRSIVGEEAEIQLDGLIASLRETLNDFERTVDEALSDEELSAACDVAGPKLAKGVRQLAKIAQIIDVFGPLLAKA